MTNSCSKTGNLARDAYFVYFHIYNWGCICSFCRCLISSLYIPMQILPSHAKSTCRCRKWKKLCIRELNIARTILEPNIFAEVAENGITC